MIVKARIFSLSLTTQLHYHSQLDKSVAWFWKSNEDNLLWILWMRSQFTWKWPPTLIEVACFACFPAGMRYCIPLLTVFVWLRKKLTSNFKFGRGLGSRVAWQVSGQKNKMTLEFFCWFAATGESKLTGRAEPDSADVQSLGDFMTCQRAFHLLWLHNFLSSCSLWIKRQTSCRLFKSHPFL